MAASKPFPGEEQTGVASDSHEACGRLRVYSIDGDQDEAMMVSQSLSLMWSDLIFGILGTGLYIGPFAVFPFIIRREPAARWAAIGALLVTIFAFLRYMRRVLPKQTYRRTIGGSVWHSSSRCKYWPTENFDEVSESPQIGVCSICVKIENRAGRYTNDGWYVS